jgi:hypothetical protein
MLMKSGAEGLEFRALDIDEDTLREAKELVARRQMQMRLSWTA